MINMLYSRKSSSSMIQFNGTFEMDKQDTRHTIRCGTLSSAELIDENETSLNTHIR